MMPLVQFSRYSTERRLPADIRLDRRRSLSLRIVWLANLVAFGMHGSSPLAQTANDWNECLRASDAGARAEACTQIIGNTHDPRSLVRALNGRGNALCAIADRCREAVPDFTSVVKLAPNVPGYADNLARALRAAGRYEEALRASDRAVDGAPRMTFTYFGKAMTLDAAGRAADALGVIDTAMALAPGDAGLWKYKGKLLGELRRYREAYAAFDQAFVLQPQRAKILVRRADVEMAEGRIDDAIGDLTRYPPGSADAELVRGELNALRAVRDRATARLPAQERKSGEAAKYDSDRAPPTAKPACNLHDWTPVAECISQYHNQNDPLPNGALNPKRWNKELAVEGQALVAKHPDVQWDRSEWNAIVAKDAEDTASQKTEIEADEEESAAAKKTTRARQSDDAGGDGSLSDRSKASGEIARCDAPWVLEYLKRSTLTPDKKLMLALKGTPLNDDAVIAGVVQQDYDANNEHRRCSANLSVTSPVGYGNKPTKVSVTLLYHIDRRLDGDHGSWATCDDCRF